jgi:hypothetical protein
MEEVVSSVQVGPPSKIPGYFAYVDFAPFFPFGSSGAGSAVLALAPKAAGFPRDSLIGVKGIDFGSSGIS